MSRTRALQALAFLLWGAAAGQFAAGGGLAGLWAVLCLARVRFPLDERDLLRLVDLSSLALIVAGIALLTVKGLPSGLLVLAGWLPVLLFPLAAVSIVGANSLRLRHVVYSLRKSTHPDAERLVEPAAPYLALSVLAAGILAPPESGLLWAIAIFFLLWIAALRRPARVREWLGFFAAAGAALALSLLLGFGLREGHSNLEQWFIDRLSGGELADPYQRQTSIGDLGRLKLSERIVWRVEQKPAKVPLRLRQGVYTHFDGRIWRAQRDAFTPFASPSRSEAGGQKLRLVGDSIDGKSILPLPLDAGAISRAVGQLEKNAYGVVRLSEAPPFLDLGVALEAGDRSGPPLPGDLALPGKLGGLLAKLPDLAALAASAEAERLAGLERWFGANFRYTLFLGDDAQGARDLERFLLHDRAGHCEYFASATVVLLRALGIPARYVSGYSVQEYSPLEKRFLVRERHAHAWVEAFVGGRWVEVDTTPPDWLGVEEARAPFWQPAADVFSFVWRTVGEWRREFQPAEHRALWIILGAVVVLIVVRAAWRRARVERSGSAGRRLGPARESSPAALRGLRRLEAELTAAGWPRPPAEAPRAWLRRVVGGAGASLSRERIAEASAIVESFYQCRYRGGRAGKVGRETKTTKD